jgi:hypothetical protein
MKRLVLMTVMSIAVMFGYAQNRTVDKVLGYDQTYVNFDGTSADKLTTGDSVWTFTINKKTDSKVFAYYYVELDSVSGADTTVNIYLQSKVFEDESYTNIDTVTYSGSADTSFVISTSSVAFGDYWRLYIIGSNDEFNVAIDKLNAKFTK